MTVRGGQTVLGLDLSSNTGWAYGPPGVPLVGTFDLGASRTFAERGARLMRALNEHLKNYSVDLAIIEEPLGLEAMKRVHTPFGTCLSQYGLTGVAMTVLQMRGVPRTVLVAPQKARKAFTGRATYRDSVHPVTHKTITSREHAKAATINACRLRGWNVASDDEADACALWSYGCGLVGYGGALFERARA